MLLTREIFLRWVCGALVSFVVGQPANPTSQSSSNNLDVKNRRVGTSRTGTTVDLAPVPLTTTFTPIIPTCTEKHFTQVSSPGLFIWINEPVPVRGVTFSDCYPSEFLDQYTTYHYGGKYVGSRAPLMSPLVCPLGWHTVLNLGNYQACCPQDFVLDQPNPNSDPDRPAYGRTCYSNFPVGQTVKVSAFDSLSFSGMSEVLASSGYQAYAHPIDGVPMSESKSNSSQLIHGSSHPDNDTSLSSGAIAGIVIGTVVAFMNLILVTYVILGKRKKRQQSSYELEATKPPPMLSPIQMIEIATMPTNEKPVLQMHELGEKCAPVAELDSANTDSPVMDKLMAARGYVLSPGVELEAKEGLDR